MNDVPNSFTGRPELDRLLGLSPEPKLPEMLSLLIRGGPGAGKTTLALQILNHRLSHGDTGMLISLETRGETVIERARTHFELARLRRDEEADAQLNAGSLMVIERKDFETKVRDARRKINVERGTTSKEQPAPGDAKAVSATVQQAGQESAPGGAKPAAGTVEDKVGYGKAVEVWHDVMRQMLEGKILCKPAAPNRSLVVVVDSLNAFADLIQQEGSDFDCRSMLAGLPAGIYRFVTESKTCCDRVVLIFTGEHRAGRGLLDGAHESFFSDIEISLTAEPIAGTSRTPVENTPASGFNIEVMHNSAEGKGPITVETRPFLRILKSRLDKHQYRRCAYELVSGEGMRMNEIYPGDGYLLLFAENDRQEKSWGEFRDHSVNHEFPALRVEVFKLKDLQRTFGTQRRFKSRPDTTDLHMATFDGYWIRWYQELRRRSAIGQAFESLGGKLREKKENRGREKACQVAVSRLVCAADKLLPMHDVIEEAMRAALKWADGGADAGGASLLSKDESDSIPFTDALISPIADALARRRGSQQTSKEQSDQDWYDALNRMRQEVVQSLQSTWEGLSNPAKWCWEPLTKSGMNGTSLARLVQEMKLPLLAALVDALLRLRQQATVFLPIPHKELRLFGEQRSEIVEALRTANAPWIQQSKPDPSRLDQSEPGDRYSAVPYNANLSCLIYREDLWDQLAEDRKDREEIIAGAKKIAAEISQLVVFSGEQKAILTTLGEPQEGHRGPGAPRCTDDQWKPCTWELIIAACEAKMGLGWQVIIETQTFDTFLCTFLEMVWACGGDLVVDREYSIANPVETAHRIFQALLLLQRMLQAGIIPPNCTAAHASLDGKSRWLVARHWYSTFIDLLPDPENPKKAAMPDSWKLRADLLPCSQSRWDEAIKSNAPLDPRKCCWGEWHLAALHGSENEALAVELINNLMSSQKVCDRALSCAAVPTVEHFYKLYSDVRCFRATGPHGIQLPGTTFGQLKDRFMEAAKQRTDIFDYRHSMRVFHGLLEGLLSKPGISTEELGNRVVKALKAIHDLRDSLLLRH